MFASLPLPPFWKEENDLLGNKVYYNSEHKHTTDEHPAISSIRMLIFRVKGNALRSNSTTMHFYDRAFRRMEVNLIKLSKGEPYVI